MICIMIGSLRTNLLFKITIILFKVSVGIVILSNPGTKHVRLVFKPLCKYNRNELWNYSLKGVDSVKTVL